LIDWNSQSNYDNQFKNDYIDDADFPLVLKTDSKKIVDKTVIWDDQKWNWMEIYIIAIIILKLKLFWNLINH
jgi:hypothetical protein